MKRLEGKVALITGAASGIGRSTALLFAAEGARIAVTDRNGELLAALRQELQDRGLSAALVLEGDVSSKEDISRIVAETSSQVGPIDILCNVAGVLDRWLQAHELPDDVWDYVIAVNLTAPFRFAREVLPSMLERRSGVIVTVSSTAGLGGGRAGTAYTVAKHGVIGLARNIAVAYGPHGIRSVAICPGAVGVRTGDLPGQQSEMGAAMVARLGATRPPSGSPDLIANALLFAASDEAAHLNAATLVVDGGWSEV